MKDTSKTEKGQVRLLPRASIDRRTAAYRRMEDLVGAIEADLGGADRLSTAERQLIQRAAISGALLEDMEALWVAGQAFDVAQYATLVNVQRRVLADVGLKRVARDVTPDFATYLAQPETK